MHTLILAEMKETIRRSSKFELLASDWAVALCESKNRFEHESWRTIPWT